MWDTTRRSASAADIARMSTSATDYFWKSNRPGARSDLLPRPDIVRSSGVACRSACETANVDGKGVALHLGNTPFEKLIVRDILHSLSTS